MGGDLGGGLNGALFSASWEIDIWGKLRNAQKAEEKKAEAFQSEVSFAKFSIAGRIAKTYFMTTETNLQIELTREMILVYGHRKLART